MNTHKKHLLQRTELLQQTLFDAVKNGNVDLVQRHLKKISSMDKHEILNSISNENNLGLLHVAVRNGDTDIVALLLQHGADLHLKDDEGKEAIHFAAKYYNIIQRKNKTQSQADKQTKNFRCLQMLLKFGANVNARDNYNATPLHLASHKGYEEVVDFLLNGKGAFVDVRDNLEFTPLHKAAIRGNIAIVRALLRAAGRSFSMLNAKNRNGSTALILACAGGRKEIVDELLHAAKFMASNGAVKQMLERDIDQNNALHAAVENENVETVQCLLDWWEKESNAPPKMFGIPKAIAKKLKDKYQYKQNKDAVAGIIGPIGATTNMCDLNNVYQMSADDETIFIDLGKLNGYTSLHLAAASGNLQLVELLVKRGASVNCLTEAEATPMHLATQGNHRECVSCLLKNKGNSELKDAGNLTPFLIASKFGFVDVIEILLENNANVHALDHRGYNGLMLAVENNQEQVVQNFLEKSSRKFLSCEEDFHGNSVLHISAAQGNTEVFRVLADSGLKLDLRNDFDETPLHLAVINNHLQIVREILQRNKASLNEQDERSRSPLHLAADYGNSEIMQELIDHGANPVNYDTDSKTALDIAIDKGWSKCADLMLKSFPFLLKRNESGAEGSFLHVACKLGLKDVVYVLLKNKADVTVRTSNGKNPLDFAIDYHHEDCANVLIEHESWRNSLSNAVIIDGTVTSPLRRLVQNMPDIAEKVLSKCMSDNGHQDEDLEYQITFDYTFLDDAYNITKWKNKDSTDRTKLKIRKHAVTKVQPMNTAGKTSQLPNGNYFQMREDSWSNKGSELELNQTEQIVEQLAEDSFEKHKAYDNSPTVLKNHPLNLMAESRNSNLVRHPLVRSFLNQRYSRYVGYIYWINILTYIVYCALFTNFMLNIPPRFALNTTGALMGILTGSPCITVIAEAQSVWGQDCINVNNVKVFTLFVVVTYASIQLIKEIISAIRERWAYFLNPINLSQCALFVLSMVIFVPLDGIAVITGIPADSQWPLGAIILLLAWLNLIYYLRLTPLGVYVFMIKSISISFVRFSLILFLLINSFTGCFYVLFQNQYSFFSYPIGLVKTLAMLAGELDFARTLQSHFVSTNYTDVSRYDYLNYIMFAVFVVFMTLLVANLLVGIAVDDISTVQKNAATEQLVVLIDFILSVEYSFPEFIRRKWMISHRKYQPNKYKGRHSLIQWIKKESGLSLKNLRNALRPKKMDLELLQKDVEKIKNEVQFIKEKLI